MNNFIKHLNEYNYAVFVSACLEENDNEENLALTIDLEVEIAESALEYYRVKGCYKGKTENSFVVLCNQYSGTAQLELLGLHDFKQESVLIIDVRENLAMLRYSNRLELIGSGLERVRDSDPHFSDNYSIIDGVKYVVGS